MDEFLAKLNTYLAAAEQVVREGAPQVWDATLFIIQLQGAMWAGVGLLAVAALVVYWVKYFPRIWAWAAAGATEAGAYNDGGYWCAAIIPSVVGTIVFGITTVAMLLDINTWLSLLHPQAALVYRVGVTAGVF
jgi:hypothetical protein